MSPNLQAAFDQQLALAAAAEQQGDLGTAFEHLERAHVLGQRGTRAHVVTHWRMLRIGGCAIGVKS